MTEVPQEVRDQIFKNFLAEGLPLREIKNKPYLGEKVELAFTLANIRTYKDLIDLLSEKTLIGGRRLSNLPACGERTIDYLWDVFAHNKALYMGKHVELAIKATQKLGDVIPEGVQKQLDVLNARTLAHAEVLAAIGKATETIKVTPLH